MDASALTLLPLGAGLVVFYFVMRAIPPPKGADKWDPRLKAWRAAGMFLPLWLILGVGMMILGIVAVVSLTIT